MCEISVVIPAYNEEAIIEQVAEEAVCTLQKTSVDSYEIVLVDDGSTDQTPLGMKQVCQRLPCVRVASHDRNRGLGAALRTGFGAATGRLVTWIPGDGQLDLSQILEGLPLLKECDIVLVLRRESRKISRGIISFCFHTLVQLMFHFDATDYCGVYLLPRQILISLAPKSNDVFYNLELALLCVKYKKRIQQITVVPRPRLRGVSKVANLRTIVKNIWEMFKFRLTI
jgi:dolichol-phosphate mannosyltransferase